jgi:hypothetical protein
MTALAKVFSCSFTSSYEHFDGNSVDASDQNRSLEARQLDDGIGDTLVSTLAPAPAVVRRQFTGIAANEVVGTVAPEWPKSLFRFRMP